MGPFEGSGADIGNVVADVGQRWSEMHVQKIAWPLFRPGQPAESVIFVLELRYGHRRAAQLAPYAPRWPGPLTLYAIFVLELGPRAPPSRAIDVVHPVDPPPHHPELARCALYATRFRRRSSLAKSRAYRIEQHARKPAPRQGERCVSLT